MALPGFKQIVDAEPANEAINKWIFDFRYFGVEWSDEHQSVRKTIVDE